MSDYLPIEDHTATADLQRQQRAHGLGLAPIGREKIIRKTTLRPGILPKALPTHAPKAKLWPRIVCKAHGSLLYRFEDGSVDWIGRAHRVINGAPTAYHPFNQNALGEIEEQRARGFTAIVRRGEYCVQQGAGDPVPGHLVSRTAYQHLKHEETDPRRYLNASTVPYISVPLELMLHWRDEWPLVLGSAASVWDRSRGDRFMAVVGDVDLHGGGGVSKYIWDRLGMGSSESSDHPFQFTIFCGKPMEGYELQRWQP